jgi:hypothetical protein
MRRFDISIVDPTKPFKSSCNGFFAQSGMIVRIVQRSKQ